MAGKRFVPEVVQDPTLEEDLESVQMSRVQFLCQKHTDDAVHDLVEISGDALRKTVPNEAGYFELELKDDEPQLLGYKPGPRVAAAKAIIEMGHGKAPQQVHHTGAQSGPTIVVIERLTDGTRTIIGVDGRPATDKTPKRAPIGDGDSSPERVEASQLPA